MSLNGTNKLCQQCVSICRQWAQIAVIKCPHFTSTQKNKPEQEGRFLNGIPLKHNNKAKEAQLEAILES